jgi:preprotein translocase subunit SecE
LVTFYHDVITEMKKVTWPDRPQLQQATIQIIIFVLLLGAVIALVDVALQALLVRLPAMLLGR